MGVIDLPSPLFGWIDAALAGFVPSLGRIAFWGVLAGLISMWLYRMISPQARIAQGKHDLAETREALNAFDGDFPEAAPIIRRMLRLSLAQVRMATLPAMVASLPVLALLAWMSTAYGYTFPPAGTSAPVAIQPEEYQAQWVAPESSGHPPHIFVSNGDGNPVNRFPLTAPVTVLHQWQWWNILVANPAGYLPSDGGVDHIRMELPRQQHLAIGPDWLRGWEFPFFVTLIAASLGIKLGARIQ